MRVFEGFLYHNKPEMLELHLENLASVVEAFVMVQSSRSFDGKPRHIATLRELGLERFESKVIQVSFSLDTEIAADHREVFQRNMMTAPLVAGGITDGDLVIISDLDEIVNPESVKRLVEDPLPLRCFGKVRFHLQFHYYYLNALIDASLQPWRLCTGVLWDRLKRSSCQQERIQCLHSKTNLAVDIENAGWHFSWFGTPEQVRQTIFTHVDPDARKAEELTVEEVKDIMESGKDIFGREMPPIRFCKELPPLPGYVTENLDRYRGLGWLR